MVDEYTTTYTGLSLPDLRNSAISAGEALVVGIDMAAIFSCKIISFESVRGVAETSFSLSFSERKSGVILTTYGVIGSRGKLRSHEFM